MIIVEEIEDGSKIVFSDNQYFIIAKATDGMMIRLPRVFKTHHDAKRFIDFKEWLPRVGSLGLGEHSGPNEIVQTLMEEAMSKPPLPDPINNQKGGLRKFLETGKKENEKWEREML